MEYVFCQQIIEGVKGDYAEFGAFEGRSFIAAYLIAEDHEIGMDFWCFDCFAGLPSSEGIFEKGQFCCDLATFRKNLKNYIKDFSNIHIIKGLFSDTLREENPLLADLKKLSIVYIDSDLYSSCKDVLSFITPYLQDGTVIYFDDWFSFKSHSDRGEQRACAEWLNANTQITLKPLSEVAMRGKTFVVNI
jgi:hypothetical protein